jgi:hypothetical protein
MTTVHDQFQQTLLTVMGQLFDAADYEPTDSPTQHSGGLFRFTRQFDASTQLRVDYQLLPHPEYPARFQITLARHPLTQPPALPPVTITLPRLLWEVFQVQVLPDPDHWWTYRAQAQLADGLLESGKLLAGYGLPWLDGSLKPG